MIAKIISHDASDRPDVHLIAMAFLSQNFRCDIVGSTTHSPKITQEKLNLLTANDLWKAEANMHVYSILTERQTKRLIIGTFFVLHQSQFELLGQSLQLSHLSHH
jgi:hypothetical protein